MEAKTVKVGNKYYREGVEVAAPVQAKKKVAPKKPVEGGLAGDDKIAKAMAATKANRRIGQNLIGAAARSLAGR